MIIGSIAVLTRVDDDRSIPDARRFPNLTTTFVSPRNGFAVSYFDGGRHGHTGHATLGMRQVDDGFDVVETGSGRRLQGRVDELPDGPARRGPASIDERVDENTRPRPAPAGSLAASRRRSPSTGSRAGSRSARTAIEATVVAGGRLYLFTLSHDRNDARAVFDAFVATIDLTPETAVDFPNLTTTFVSPTYGYSFRYHDRGGLAPATELWDPVNQPSRTSTLDDRFDAVETGFGAYFEGASTPIPDGVSIDDWVDEYVSPGGCGVPRSQQEEITIDGQPGRVAECLEQIEATVVAGGRLYLFTLGSTHGRQGVLRRLGRHDRPDPGDRSGPLDVTAVRPYGRWQCSKDLSTRRSAVFRPVQQLGRGSSGVVGRGLGIGAGAGGPSSQSRTIAVIAAEPPWRSEHPHVEGGATALPAEPGSHPGQAEVENRPGSGYRPKQRGQVRHPRGRPPRTGSSATQPTSTPSNRRIPEPSSTGERLRS